MERKTHTRTQARKSMVMYMYVGVAYVAYMYYSASYTMCENMIYYFGTAARAVYAYAVRILVCSCLCSSVSMSMRTHAPTGFLIIVGWNYLSDSNSSSSSSKTTTAAEHRTSAIVCPNTISRRPDDTMMNRCEVFNKLSAHKWRTCMRMCVTHVRVCMSVCVSGEYADDCRCRIRAAIAIEHILLSWTKVILKTMLHNLNSFFMHATIM